MKGFCEWRMGRSKIGYSRKYFYRWNTESAFTFLPNEPKMRRGEGSWTLHKMRDWTLMVGTTAENSPLQSSPTCFSPQKSQSNNALRECWDVTEAAPLHAAATDADRSETNGNLFFTAPHVPSIKCSQEKVDDSNKSCHGNASSASSRCFQLTPTRLRWARLEESNLLKWLKSTKRRN